MNAKFTLYYSINKKLIYILNNAIKIIAIFYFLFLTTNLIFDENILFYKINNIKKNLNVLHMGYAYFIFQSKINISHVEDI